MPQFGDFELIAEIGDGAASRVWSARHVPSDTPVAIKFFNQVSGKRNTEHLIREIRLVAQAAHPQIVKVFGYGVCSANQKLTPTASLTEGQVYLVMEWVQRGTLKELLGRTDWTQTRSILVDILTGLARVHARGIVHLDLKPGNVLIADRGAIISDFGIARARKSVGRADSTEASSALARLAIVGTPHFMSPEQCLSASSLYGPWTDLYAVGCIAHCLVTGRPPFREKEIVDVLIAHRTKPIPKLEDSYRVPVGFDRWLAKLLAKQWQERFLWAEDAKTALLRLGRPSGRGRPSKSISTWTDPTMLSHDDVSDETMLDVIIARDERPSGIIPLISDQPEVPARWQDIALDLAPSNPLDEEGLEMIQFETAHLVGRIYERQQLWKSFASAAHNKRLHTTVLSGRPGTGKSALAEWLCCAVHEQGLGHYIQIRNTRDVRSQDGLIGALRSFFGLRPDVDGPAVIGERLGLPLDDVLCRGLFSELGGADSSGHFDRALLSQKESDHLLCRLFLHLAELRTLVIHVDDAQWGFDSLRVLDELQSLDARARLHIVITVNEDEPITTPYAASFFSRLNDLRNLNVVDVGPLNVDDCTEYVQTRAKLTSQQIDELVRLSEGNPLFVREFLLSKVSATFARAQSGTTSMQTLWRFRIEQWLRDVSEDVESIIFACAVLGMSFSLDEWRLLVEGEEKRLRCSDVLSSGVERGFFVIERDGDVAFVHGLLRNAILELAKDSGDLERLNQRAGALFESQQSTDYVRVATFYQEGGDLESASRYWALAVEHYRQVDAYRRLRWALGRWLLVLRRLKRRRTDDEWLTLSFYWFRTDKNLGLVQRSLVRMDRLQRRVESLPEKQTLLIKIMLERANCRQRLVGPGEVQQELSVALDLARTSAPELYPEVLLTVAKDLKLVGKYSEAESLYRQALSAMGEGERYLRLRASGHVRLGDCLSRRDKYEDALAEVKKGVKLARKSNSPHLLGDVLNLYGEVLRASGYLGPAETAYREASELMEDLGSSTRFFVRANVAIILQLRGDFVQSRKMVDTLLKDPQVRLFPRARVSFNSLLLPCLVVANEFEEYDRVLRRVEEILQLDWAEFDIAQATFRAATRLQNIGEDERAVRTYRVVLDQYEKLELGGEVEQIKRIIGEFDEEHVE